MTYLTPLSVEEVYAKRAQGAPDGGVDASRETQPNPRTSVIIPTWNASSVLRDCLESLGELEEPAGGFEVLVVDNGSTDETELMLRRRYRWVRLVRSEVNLGFSKACNLGMANARGEYLVLLNNDTIVEPSWLVRLVSRADASPAGAIASKVLFAGEGKIINNAGSVLRPGSDWPAADRGINEPDEGQYNEARQITAFCGAAVLLKRSMLDVVGIFDEAFFMYWEDIDLSWRAVKAGWSLEFEPTAIVRHVHAASSGEASRFFRYNVSRNRLLVLAKHGQPRLLARALVKVSWAFLAPAATAGVRGKWSSVARELTTLSQVLASFACSLPVALSKRFGYRRERALPPSGPVPMSVKLEARAGAREPSGRLRIGIYNPYLGTLGGGERLTAAMAEALSEDHDVEILARRMHGLPTVQELEERFDVKLPGVRIVDLDGKLIGGEAQWIPAGPRRRVADVRDFWLARGRGYDFFINNQFWSLMKCPAPAGIYLCMFPRVRRDERPRSSETLRALVLRAVRATEQVVIARPDEAMLSYSSVLTISHFTNHWLREWWRIPGRVVYPPCKDWFVAGARKRPVILSVGRFFAPHEDRHHKRQDALLEAFSLLSLVCPDWELHLAGSKAPDAESASYVEALQADAQGLRVYLHLDATLGELEHLYNEARFYWHGTGYGSEPGRHPEREEHFGITTVEAMSAGAVPMVFPGGGQIEIVTDGVNGYFWRSLRQLVSQTITLIGDEDRWRAMSLRARETAKRFRPERFAQSFKSEVQRGLGQVREGP